MLGFIEKNPSFGSPFTVMSVKTSLALTGWHELVLSESRCGLMRMFGGFLCGTEQVHFGLCLCDLNDFDECVVTRGVDLDSSGFQKRKSLQL